VMVVSSACVLVVPSSNPGRSKHFFLIEDTKVSKCNNGVTILSILTPQEEHIVNIVTPRGTYTKILSDLRTNERLSNEQY
jgi:hypothetical protein